MCFDNCNHFSFNPVTGEGGCKRGNKPCTQDEEENRCDGCGSICDRVFKSGEFFLCENCLEEAEL